MNGSQRVEWVEHKFIFAMGDEPVSTWYRGTVLQILRGWFRTKLVVAVEEWNTKDGWQKLYRKNVQELNLGDVANWL